MANNNFGVKVSLPGFSVESAADSDLYFNSSWPLLKIDDALSGTMTLTGTAADSVTHNLGYPPFVMVWSHANGFYNYYISNINSQTVAFNTTQAQLNVGDTIRYYIFRNPLNINFQAPNINLAATQQGTNHQDFGIKFSKPGKDVSSTDLRDFTIHSGTKSLQVHQVVYQPFASVLNLGGVTTWGIKQALDLPYRPVWFAYKSSDNVNFFPVFTTAQVPPVSSYVGIDNSINISDLSGTVGWGVFYVLLDPYQSTNQVNLTL